MEGVVVNEHTKKNYESHLFYGAVSVFTDRAHLYVKKGQRYET